MKVELDITLVETTAAKQHKCDYCDGQIQNRTKYYNITSRKVGVERFPHTLKVCNKHDPKLLPFSLLLKR